MIVAVAGRPGDGGTAAAHKRGNVSQHEDRDGFKLSTSIVDRLGDREGFPARIAVFV